MSKHNPIRYVGGYYDTQTALYKFGARYYNSVDARWTQLDPSGAEKGYLYAGDNPVNYTDPSGYAPCAAGLTPNVINTCPSLPLSSGGSTNWQCVAGVLETVGGAGTTVSQAGPVLRALSAGKSAPGAIGLAFTGIAFIGTGIEALGAC